MHVCALPACTRAGGRMQSHWTAGGTDLSSDLLSQILFKTEVIWGKVT